MRLARHHIFSSLAFFAIIFFLSIYLLEKRLESKSITNIKFDGISIFANSEGLTIENIFKNYNIQINENDIISHPLYSPAPMGGTVTITRVKERVETKENILPAKIRKKVRLKKNLRIVELQKVEQKKTIQTIKTVYRNQKLYKREILKELSILKTSYFLNVLDKKGNLEKKYDLSKCRRIKMMATAYRPGDPLAWKDGKVTYLGLKMQRGIVAVDPRVIPLRTRLFIPGYGYCYAGDTGSAIKGKRIDLGVNNLAEEAQWVYQPVTVYILEKNQKL
ncbi:MAG: 3D domain-containing protein [Elusimicrobia bacterium]|nr:3D domain-containing protein [Elusimicrobiota bacterium]